MLANMSKSGMASVRGWCIGLVSIGLAALSSGCGGGGGDSDAIQFVDIACTPDVLGGATVVDGQSLECSFRVEGMAEGDVTLSCEDDSGAAIDCGSASDVQLQPFGSNPLPIENGYFGMSTTGLAGTTAVVVWVADDGTNQVRRRFEAAVTADDGNNEAPSIAFDCGGDTDGAVDVVAGDELACTIRFLDADPDTLSWSYAAAGGNTPVSNPRPFSGSGTAPVEVDWRWSTDAGEAGTSWTFTFSVEDGTAPAVTRDLVVTVQ